MSTTLRIISVLLWVTAVLALLATWRGYRRGDRQWTDVRGVGIGTLGSTAGMATVILLTGGA